MNAPGASPLPSVSGARSMSGPSSAWWVRSNQTPSRVIPRVGGLEIPFSDPNLVVAGPTQAGTAN